MAGSYVLDTNVVISLLGNDPGVKAQLEGSERVGIPAIVIGELYYGACSSGQVQASGSQCQAAKLSSSSPSGLNHCVVNRPGPISNSLILIDRSPFAAQL